MWTLVPMCVVSWYLVGVVCYVLFDAFMLFAFFVACNIFETEYVFVVFIHGFPTDCNCKTAMVCCIFLYCTRSRYITAFSPAFPRVVP